MLEEFLNMGKESSVPFLPFIEKIEDYKNFRVMRLKGAIDMSTIPEFSKMVPKAKNNKGSLKQNLLLDFRKVTHVDSSTIAILLVALNELKHEKHKLVLANVPENLKGMLDISEINDLFTIYDSEEDAYNDLKEGK